MKQVTIKIKPKDTPDGPMSDEQLRLWVLRLLSDSLVIEILPCTLQITDAAHGEAHDWSSEWPTEPGRYWFYGWRSTFAKNNSKPSLMMVNVRQVANSLMFITDGVFLYKGEGAEGVFCSAIAPSLPEAAPVAAEDEKV